jgi:type IX secretion system PorP/SprF family membrane protein
MKKILAIAFVLFSALQLAAQQDAMYTHYAFNTLTINPAYAGNRGMLSATAIHRSQWVGFDGAPMSQSFVLSTPLLNDKLGLGMSLQNDRLGPTSTFNGTIDLAYKLKINSKSKLSFGMSAGINNIYRNLGDLAIHEQGDYAVDNDTRSQNIFDMGIGLLYTNKRFYAGISSPRILNTHVDDKNPNTNTLASKEKQHYYFTAGTAFDLGKKVECKPSTFVKMTEGVHPQFDLTAMFVFNKKFEIGAMWRTSDAAGVLLGYTINKSLRIGYSFDWSYGLKTFQNNFGSHEVMLRYDLFKRHGEDIISPRYF